MSRIGIYPGTFDMLHDGHVAFAIAAIEKCQLDNIVFLPETFPRGKNMVSPIDVRIAYIEKQLTNEPALTVQHLDIATFSVTTTLPQLVRIYGNDLVMLIGSDVAMTLKDWPDLAELTEHVHFAVGLRSDADVDTLAPALEALSVRYDLITTDKAHLSSSMYRSFV